MNKRIILSPLLLMGIIILFLFACNSGTLPNPKVQADTAKISGRILTEYPKSGDDKSVVTISVPNSVTGDFNTFETRLKDDGSFSFEVPLESSPSILVFYTPMFGSNCVSVPVTSKDITKVEVTFKKDGKLKVMSDNALKWTSDDMVNSWNMFNNFIDGGDNVPVYSMAPEEFSRLAIDSFIPKRLKRSFNDSILSESAKIVLNDECRLRYLSAMLYYNEYMELNYRNFGPQNGADSFKPFPTPRSYYALLKQFDLNNPKNLYNSFYAIMFQRLLENNTLNIPKINDIPVNNWLNKVKPILSDLVGFNDGLFYDMLVANSYSLQLSNELKPLTDKQKENIKQYFTNKGFTSVLFRKNEEIVRLANELKQSEIVPVPKVPEENLLTSIVSKYKGKTIIVDFWATWCGPCMTAMERIRKVKSEMTGKDVVFVYITNASSPKKLWEEKVKQIGGKHYYLTNEEWEYIMNSHGFSSIPSYLFYDAEGRLKNKMTGFPGTLEMQKMIECAIKR